MIAAHMKIKFAFKWWWKCVVWSFSDIWKLHFVCRISRLSSMCDRHLKGYNIEKANHI